MNLLSSDLIQPLERAESDGLQVLINKFSLKRDGNGSLLEVSFDNDTPALWTWQAKLDIIEMIKDFDKKAAKYQKELDSFLVDKEGTSFDFDDPEFCFRYASGGTLPILRIDGQDYYCLFYRLVPPIGWNIANGGCDTREELLHPSYAAQRELREELIIVDLDKGIRYVFDDDADKDFDAPEFRVARKLWKDRFPEYDFPSFKEVIIPLKWMSGEDSVKVHVAGESGRALNVFLNINALDFGIEIDKVAKININEQAVLCNGEVKVGRLLNTPVGLFKVEDLNVMAMSKSKEFIPDKFFYNAKPYSGEHLDSVIHEQCISDINPIRSRKERAAWDAAKLKYDLCPVTRRIIRRCIASQVLIGEEERICDVFISFNSEDKDIARKVYDFLVDKGKKVFFCEKQKRADFGRMIDMALESAKCLIAVGSKPGNLKKDWPEYEYRSFHNDILSGRKRPKEAYQLISFIVGFEPTELPRPLCNYHAVKCDQQSIDQGMKELFRYIHEVV